MRRCHALSQNAERHDRVKAVRRVARVAVDVLEGIALGIGHWHQLDHADRGMVGHASRFVEIGPAHEVLLDDGGQLADEWRDANLLHEVGHGGNVDKAGHGVLP